MNVLTVTCSGCGSAVPAGDRFCGSCGNPITGSAILSGEGAGAFDPWVELLQKLRVATLGEYEIKGELGRGGMAAVFLAHDLHLNRKVAIKVMLPGLLYSERMWERFLAEARTAAKLDHPNIIYIHSVKEKDRFLYFVMKYVDGRPLDDMLSRSGPMSIPLAQAILVEVARALDYAHREGVIHRDIKPANIMIDGKGNAIVMDFGIARAADSAHFTQTGATIGTPAYMSPEQCHGHDVTAASDQYSLGVVAYEMLSGKQPFTGSPIELQLAHIQDTPRPLRELRKDLPSDLADAVMKMLEKDPRSRHPTLGDVVAAFSRNVDIGSSAIRNEIAAMAKSGPPNRPSFPPTPASPIPGTGPAVAPRKKTTPLDEAVHSAETASVAAVGSDAHSRPTASIDSGQQDAVTLVGGVRDGHDGTTAERGKSKRTPMLIGAAAVIVIGVGAAIFSSGSGSKAGASSASKADSAAAQPAAAPNPSSAIEAALGDSVVVGHGPDANVPFKGAPPKAVGTDAIALLNLSLAKGTSVRVGDTTRIHLEVLDDNGAHVTSHQIVWATSNAHVVKFAGPGKLVGMREGKATITVGAGSTAGSLAIVVGPRSAPASKKK